MSQSSRAPLEVGQAAGSVRLSGEKLVVALVALAAALGLFAVWFQWGQTRRCLALLGPEAARRIQTARRVELWPLTTEGGRIVATERLDVSAAPGLVHLRRGLVEDDNYRWDGQTTSGPTSGPTSGRLGPLPAAAWDVAIAFADDDSAPATILAFDLAENGAMTQVGRPGRVMLGRIGPGLRRWLTAAVPGFSPEKSAF